MKIPLNKKSVVLWKLSVILVLVLSIMYRNYTRQKFQDNLNTSIQQYNDGVLDEIDFSAITPFSWNRLYIYPPYTGCYKPFNPLKAPLMYLNCEMTLTLQLYEYESLLVFTNHGFISQYLVVDTILEDYHNTLKEEGYSIDEAVFVLNDYENGAAKFADVGSIRVR
jgi:hypothetical protein